MGKVIQFPEKDENQKQQQAGNKVTFELENKKVMVSASLVTLLFLVTLINASLFTQKEQQTDFASTNGRGIASLGEYSGLVRNTEWEHDLAKRLSKASPQRGIASIGKAPSREDQLLYRFLDGNYLVRMNTETGKLVALEFAESQELSPKVISNRQAFISDYRSILGVEFSRATTLDTLNSPSKERRREVYALWSSGEQQGEPVARVEFELDKNDKMYSMKVVTLASQ